MHHPRPDDFRIPQKQNYFILEHVHMMDVGYWTYSRLEGVRGAGMSHRTSRPYLSHGLE